MFLSIQKIRRSRRSFQINDTTYEELKIPYQKTFNELLLLGTVADVVPLTGENRFWVRQGLNYVREEESLALRILKARR